MTAYRLLRFAARLVLIAAAPACTPKRGACVPEPLASSPALVDPSVVPAAYEEPQPTLTREVAAEFRRRGAGQHPPGARPYRFLALSGGGLYGSFGVGVLTGWSESGERPRFDVVTGISTGALLSTFAFLGPEYDAFLRQNIVGAERSDFLFRRTLAAIPFIDSACSSEPLERRIDAAVTPEVLGAVAREHAAGRRLYIGTTNLDTRRLVVWDMGAIASRGTPESAALYRKIVLASSSVPGVVQPVRLPVEINGKTYEELHVDGGVSDELIFRTFMVAEQNRVAGRPGPYAPPGSTLYVISNGKVYADPGPVGPRIMPVVAASGKSLIYAKMRDELFRIFLHCLETGVEFRLTAVPRGVRLTPDTNSLKLTPAEQELLFAEGRSIGRRGGRGADWRDLPPDAEPAEQARPRTGTQLITDGAGQ